MPSRPTPQLPAPSRAGTGRSFSILSTFPPTACGIATFSAALAKGLVECGATVSVVRCGEDRDAADPVVVADLPVDPAGDLAPAIAALNAADVAIVQHEYGIFGGPDGDEVLEVLGRLVVPTIVVAHTVLQAPTAHQRSVLTRVCAAADVVVVMTASARARLVDGFGVPEHKVSLVPHGALATNEPILEAYRGPDHSPRILTWGLIGPGKGIEWAIDAVATLSDIRPWPTYVVAGATHPKVLAWSGEAYRNLLEARAERHRGRASVLFDAAYRDLPSLQRLIRSADVVVLPYDSTDQVTSGVLVDAVAAGRPVVATAFPHAVELLGSGAGIVVPQRDPVALAAAIRAVLTDPDLAASMTAEARRLAPTLSWHAVAAQYDRLAASVIAAAPAAVRA